MGLADTIGNFGYKLGLPEFGISEFLGGVNQQTAFGNKTPQDYALTSKLATERQAGLPALNPAQQFSYAKTGSIGSQPTQTQQPAPTGGGDGGGGGSPRDAFNRQRGSGAYAGWGDAEAWADFQATGGQQGAEEAARNQLNQGYDDYFRSLDEQMAGLGGQRTGQENLANKSYDTGLQNVQGQYDLGQQNLDTNRQKTLRDLSDNLQQSWKQGNVFLGTRGASDSSAANQYSFALAKEGNRSRGDVQGQYDQNMFQMKNVFDTETRNLDMSKSQQLQQISQWFEDAQNSLKREKSGASLQRSQEALGIAMQMAQKVEQETSSRRSILDQWAANNAKSFGELGGMLQQSANFSTQAPSNFGTFGGQSRGSFGPTGSNYRQEDEDRRRGIF